MIGEGGKALFWSSVLAVIIVCAAFVLVAVSHSEGPGAWINHQRLTDPITKEWCCNLQDCREETSNIEETKGGFLVKSTGEIIPQERVIWRAPAGEWWRCRYLGGEKEGKTRCLIGPAQTG